MSDTKYERVNDSDEEHSVSSGHIQSKYRVSTTRRLVQVGLCAFFLVLSVAISFEAGRRSAAIPSSHAIEFNIKPHVFRYNRSFSDIPNNHTNRSWRELFPKEGGFFVHDEIAPTRSTFHVFHTLHCLNHVRKAYWINHQAANAGLKLLDDDVFVDFKPSHVRHCIDLIRQSLMCSADTTLEVVDDKVNGVQGFRTEHQCVDWEQLRDWTTARQLEQHVSQIE